MKYCQFYKNTNILRVLFWVILSLGVFLIPSQGQAIAPPIFGTNYFYGFDDPAGKLNTTQTYSDNGVTITAMGYLNDGTPANLFGTSDAVTGQFGLGLNSQALHAIDANNFVQLDLTNLLAQNLTSLDMMITGIKGGDSWNLYESNKAGSLGTLLQSGNTLNPSTFSILPAFLSSGNHFLAVQAGLGDVMLTELHGVSVPEPTTLLLISTGLAFAARRRRQKKTS